MVNKVATSCGVWLPGRYGRRPIKADQPLPPPSDQEATLSLIANLADRAEEALAGQQTQRSDALPSFPITDRNLAHFLSRAEQSSSAIAGRGAPTGPRLASETYIDQATTNDAVINCLHQLDHRTLGGRTQLDRLESMLSETMRRLDRVEALLDGSGISGGGSNGSRTDGGNANSDERPRIST
ncbi:MAG: hypothetical protein ACRBK7_17030 [Acidimicrobiales bacterium]